MKRLVLAILFVLLFAGPGWTTTYYVASTGSNTSPYDTWEKAANLISTVAAIESDGDVFYLLNETHTVDGSLNIAASIYNENGDNDYTSCIIQGHAVNGGRIKLIGGTMTVQGITFQNNPSACDYGCIDIDNADVTINYCYFYNNKGRDAAANKQGSAMTSFTSSTSTLSCSHSIFESNESGRGGACYFNNQITPTFSDCTFTSNTAKHSSGGAIAASSCGQLTLTDCDFTGNSAETKGGAIEASNIDLSISGGSFTSNIGNYQGNSNGDGCAIHMQRSQNTSTNNTLSISGEITFDGNYAYNVDGGEVGDGGAIKTLGSDSDDMITFTISDAIFQNNYAYQGGGLMTGRYSSGTVSRCYFYNNGAFDHGGGAYRGGVLAANAGETTTFNTCIFISNKTGYQSDMTSQSAGDGHGGGVGVTAYAKVILNNCSFYDNKAWGTDSEGDGFDHWDHTTDNICDGDDNRSELINCVFYGSGSNVEIKSDSGTNGTSPCMKTVNYCAYESGEATTPDFSPTNIVTLTSSPFMNASNGDFRLRLDSPARGAATDPIALGLTEDFRERKYRASGPWDIGPYQSSRTFVTLGEMILPIYLP